MKNKIMTPKHKGWIKFLELLEGPEGCNFREIQGTTMWNCKAGKDKTLAENILKTHFQDVDVDKTMDFFEDNGGHCDCEILFNVGT